MEAKLTLKLGFNDSVGFILFLILLSLCTSLNIAACKLRYSNCQQ